MKQGTERALSSSSKGDYVPFHTNNILNTMQLFQDPNTGFIGVADFDDATVDSHSWPQRGW